jgi:RNA-directed DNA polymerase
MNSTHLLSLRALEMLLGYSREEIIRLASTAGSYYQPFRMTPNMKPFQKKPRSAKVRDIDNPTGDLKEIQKRIQRSILRPVSMPENVCGGVKGRSVLDNVMIHRSATTLVTLDIRDFFPSITNDHVYRVWREVLRYSPKVSGLLTKLTTFERHLPQGAPTSTSLANLVLLSVDPLIRQACAEMNVLYSVYVDDMAFSGDRAPEVINVAARVLKTAGFAVSRRKLGIMRQGHRKILNGVLVALSPGVPKTRRSAIRSAIHHLSRGQVTEEEITLYRRRVDGNITQLATIKPVLAERLRQDLMRAEERARRS